MLETTRIEIENSTLETATKSALTYSLQSDAQRAFRQAQVDREAAVAAGLNPDPLPLPAPEDLDLQLDNDWSFRERHFVLERAKLFERVNAEINDYFNTELFEDISSIKSACLAARLTGKSAAFPVIARAIENKYLERITTYVADQSRFFIEEGTYPLI